MSNQTNHVPYIRVFISSPGDVNDEREVARKVIEQLPYQPVFRERVAFRVVAWDKEGAGTSMRMTMTPQEAINRGLPRPSECDIVIVIFWSRMGTRFVDKDGEEYESGTHWELLDAINSERSRGRTLVYRRMEKRSFESDEEDDFEQYKRLQSFFDSELFYEDGRITGGVNQYKQPENFRQEFEVHFQELVLEILGNPLDTQNIIPDDDILDDEILDGPNITTIEPQKWTRAKSPFPGLRAFTKDDADIFFGRGAETDDLVEQLRDSRFIAVIASSGSGKSSLVGAGLIPRLSINSLPGSKDWRIARFTPSTNPYDGLFNALMVAFPEEKPSLFQLPAIKRQFMQDVRNNPQVFLDICNEALQNYPDWVEVFLFIDQFEELFTLSHPDDTQSFINLLSIITDNSRIRVVVTLRSEFQQRVVDNPKLASLLRRDRGVFPLTIPEEKALYQMIARPAERAGITFEDDLIDEILKDVGNEPGNLALMAYALDELYKLDDNNILTFKEYHQLGGVQGAIGTRAKNIWDSLNIDESTVDQIFMQLVEVDEQGFPTRRRVPIEWDLRDNDDPASVFINAFINGRLLTTGYDEEAEVETVEVAHEAILVEWDTLKKWIDLRSSDFQIIAQMRTRAKYWANKGKRLVDLPRGEQVDEFNQACENLRIVLNQDSEPLLFEFVQDQGIRYIQVLQADDVDFKIYQETIYQLKQINGDEGAAHLAILTNQNALNILSVDEQRRIYQHAINELARLDDERAIDPIISLLNHTESLVRISSINALGKLYGSRAVDSIIQLLGDDDPNVREASAKALGQLNAEAAVIPLIKLLQDPNINVAETSTIALVQLGSKRAVPHFIEQLETDDIDRKMMSVAALGRLGDRRAVKPLITLLADVNTDLAIAIISALGQLGDENAVLPLLDLLENHNNTDEVRIKSMEALCLLKDKRAVTPLISVLQDYDNTDEVRIKSIEILGLLTDERATDPLIDSMKDNNPEVRQTAKEALSHLSEVSQFAKYVTQLQDADYNIRAQGVQALGQLGDERAVRFLIDALSDEHFYVRRISVLSLSLLKSAETIIPLINVLEDSDMLVRQSSARALGELGDEDAIIPLINLLDDPEESVRRTAKDALAQLDNTGKLIELIEKSRHFNASVRKESINDLIRLGGKPVIVRLMNIMFNDADAEVRGKAEDGLWQLESAQNFPNLIELLNNGSTKDRVQSAEALAKIGNDTVIPHLINALHDGDPMIRAQSAWALGKLGTGSNEVSSALMPLLNDEVARVRASALCALQHQRPDTLDVVREFNDDEAITELGKMLFEEKGNASDRKLITDTLDEMVNSIRAQAIIADWNATKGSQ